MTRYAPIYMTLYDGPDTDLEDLTLSASTFAAGAVEDTEIGTISGKSADGVLSILNDTGQVKIDGDTLVVGPTPTEEAGTLEITIRETNPWGTNSPHDTEFELTVTE